MVERAPIENFDTGKACAFQSGQFHPLRSRRLARASDVTGAISRHALREMEEESLLRASRPGRARHHRLLVSSPHHSITTALRFHQSAPYIIMSRGVFPECVQKALYWDARPLDYVGSRTMRK